MKTLVSILFAAAILAGDVALCAQVGAAQVSAPPDILDISGYWELSIDGRFVPPARLSPSVTQAMIDAEARKIGAQTVLQTIRNNEAADDQENREQPADDEGSTLISVEQPGWRHAVCGQALHVSFVTHFFCVPSCG